MFADDYNSDPRSKWRLQAAEDSKKAMQFYEALLNAARKDLGVDALSVKVAEEILRMPGREKENSDTDTEK